MRLLAIVFFLFGNAALYLGIWLLLDTASLGTTNPALRVPFGVLLVLYGAFRIYTAVRKWKKGDVRRVPLVPSTASDTIRNDETGK